MQSQSTKVIMALWLRWKKPVKSAITLDPESVDGSYDMGNNTSDSYIKVEMPINSFNRQFFEGSNTEELLQRMFEHIKAQVENPQMSESGFTLDQIMHLHINFHKLVLTRGNFCIVLPEWIAKKKAVIY